MGQKLTATQEKGIHELFRRIDKNHDGVIDIKEVADRFKIPYDEAWEFVSKNDRDKQEGLNEAEFRRVIEKHILRVFRKFDANGDGKITSAETEHVLRHLDLQEVDTKRFIEKLSQLGNGNGQEGCITFEEFLNGLFVELAIHHHSILV